MALRRSGLEAWIQRRLRADPPRSKSLMMTIFGDAIAPYSSGVWLSELIGLLEPFGINERLVRTSGFRLVEEGWLKPERQGRLSRYALTASGWQRVEHASRRIYDPPSARWNGKWTWIMLRRSENLAAERLQLRRELEWEGFGTLAPGMYVHPCADRKTVREVLERLGLSKNVVAVEASALEEIACCSTSILVRDCWRLEFVGARYEAFVQTFRPVLRLLDQRVDPQAAFVVQTLLIHAFRRVVLHDPRLPMPLLPADWAGSAAYDLCREIYLHTFPHTQTFLAERVAEISAKMKPTRQLMSRFGGLQA